MRMRAGAFMIDALLFWFDLFPFKTIVIACNAAVLYTMSESKMLLKKVPECWMMRAATSARLLV